MSKILTIDIEWSPATAYVFQVYDAIIGPDHIIDSGGLLCFAWHWAGEKNISFMSEWEDGKQAMAIVLRDLLDAADAVVTYNGNKYDLPKIRGHLMLEGLKPFAPPTSIDLIKTVKSLGFVMAKLAYIGPLLGVGQKMKHEGFQLWRSVMEGDLKAQGRMKRYCIQDVRVTANLYKRIQPFIINHPHLNDSKGDCASCGSTKIQLRGFRRTKYFKTQRLQCTDCGGWSTGTRTKI